MHHSGQIGRLLIIAGILLVVIGLVFFFSGSIPWLGKLPGDIQIKRDNFTFHFPLTTCIILSIVLTLLFAIFRLIRR